MITLFGNDRGRVLERDPSRRVWNIVIRGTGGWLEPFHRVSAPRVSKLGNAVPLCLKLDVADVVCVVIAATDFAGPNLVDARITFACTAGRGGSNTPVERSESSP